MMVKKNTADEPRDDRGPDKGQIAASPYEAPMDGHMGLGDVVYWVASNGHSYSPADDIEAFEVVRSAIDRGHLQVEGLNKNNVMVAIPGNRFSNVTAFEPSETQDFFSPIEDKHPKTQFGGTLTPPREDEPELRRIRCRVADVIKLWPFGHTQSEETQSGTIGPRKPSNRAIKMWAVDAAVKSLWPGGVPWNVDGGIPQVYKTKIINHAEEQHGKKYLDNSNKTIQRYFSDHYGWDNM